jgi:hypothetical protein
MCGPTHQKDLRMRNEICSVLRKISEATLWAYISVNMVTRIRGFAKGMGRGVERPFRASESKGQQSGRKNECFEQKNYFLRSRKTKFLNRI